MKHNKIYIFLIVTNLFWSAMAFIYDFDKIINLPAQIWPFIIICPIYPLLLAVSWLFIYLKHRNRLIITFSAFNSLIFFIAALIYYPVWMIINGFDLLAFGQIFWVAFYGLQGAYLVNKIKLNQPGLLISIIFLLLTFLIQCKTNSFGFFDTANFSQTLILVLYGVLSLGTVLLAGVLLVKNRT